MTYVLRDAPALSSPPALPLCAFGYSGQAGRCEARFPQTLAFPRAIRPLTGILCKPVRGRDLTLWARVEILDIGVSPPTPWGKLWGVQLRRPITGLALWLTGADAVWHRLSWACCYRFLGHSDPAGPGAWRTGLHGKDPLVALRVALAPLQDAAVAEQPSGPPSDLSAPKAALAKAAPEVRA